MSKTENNQEPAKFLYGAAVQGIQGFIFQTNELRDIVGASELVADVCTDLFDEVLKTYGVTIVEKNAIVMAAGNIKYIFDSEDDCKTVVRIFPKTVMEYAPGITISQAVVKYNPNDTDAFANAVQKLESKLRIQRNKPMRDTTIGLMGIERSRQTGLPVTHIVNGQHLDEGTYRKLYTNQGEERKNTTQELCDKAFGDNVNKGLIPFDIEKITGLNDWIAIIHADGNGLGQVVQRVGGDPQKLERFSKKLDVATTNAAVKAFKDVMEVAQLKEGDKIPVRPIVLSGDDHTLLCRADLAMRYVKAFIENFKTETERLLGNSDGKQPEGNLLKDVFKGGENYLTACAGIAFIKSSYPFYYGYQLAEALCDRAKKDTKALYNANDGNLPASCLMFHKVQDSFITSYDDIVKRELTPQPNVSFEFGPYYINAKPSNRWTVDNLVDNKSLELEKEDMRPVKAGLRNWLSLIHINSEMAAQRLDRLKYISGKDSYISEVTKSREHSKEIYPVYDILAINAVKTKETKTKKETQR